MILIFSENDKHTKNYTEFLSNEKVDHVVVTLEDLIKKVKIKDKFSDDEESCQWEIDNQVFDIYTIKSIYYQCRYPSIDYFFDFLKEDREYARQEWFAYIIYRLFKNKTVVNPIPHENISGCPFALPRIYELASQLNFEIPKWHFSSNLKKFDKFQSAESYVYKTSLHDYYNLSRESSTIDNAIMAVELQKGAQVIVRVIGEKTYSTIIYQEGKEGFNLPKELIDKCIALTKKIGLLLAEIMMIRTRNNKYIIYYLSPSINWNLSHGTNEDEWRGLTHILTES